MKTLKTAFLFVACIFAVVMVGQGIDEYTDCRNKCWAKYLLNYERCADTLVIDFCREMAVLERENCYRICKDLYVGF